MQAVEPGGASTKDQLRFTVLKYISTTKCNTCALDLIEEMKDTFEIALIKVLLLICVTAFKKLVMGFMSDNRDRISIEKT